MVYLKVPNRVGLYLLRLESLSTWDEMSIENNARRVESISRTVPTSAWYLGAYRSEMVSFRYNADNNIVTWLDD